MSWVTVIWSMVAPACLTLAAVSFLVWYKRRTVWDGLLFTLTLTGVAVYAGCELAMVQVETPAQFATSLRWVQVPTWVIVLSLVGFARFHLRSGLRWLAWTVCALLTVSLSPNFLLRQKPNYLEVTHLRPVQFVGESVSLGEGVFNQWMILRQLGSIRRMSARRRAQLDAAGELDRLTGVNVTKTQRLARCAIDVIGLSWGIAKPGPLIPCARCGRNWSN